MSEKGLSAMERRAERLTLWLNQKTANILGDLQEREPVEDPSPTRAVCRIFFVVSLLLGFSLLLAYNFIDAPDAQVVQIHRLTPGDKNHAFPSCFLYDRESPNCTKWSKAKFPEGIPVSCPCTNTSAPWKRFVKFYALHENSTDWNMSVVDKYYTDYDYHFIEFDEGLGGLRNENIVKNKNSLTPEEFCNVSHLWPHAIINTVGEVIYGVENISDRGFYKRRCVPMAGLLFSYGNDTKDAADQTRSTRFLNTQTLLNREELNTILAKLARESVNRIRLDLDMTLSMNVGNENLRRFYNALAHLLTELLDRDQMDLNQSYIYGADQLSGTLDSNQFYDNNSFVWFLRDDSGPIFLQPEIDWEKYREHCFPEYCEVIKPMRKLRKLYWAFGILGGVATIVLAVVTMLLWPCTAMLLLRISGRRRTTATRDPERPRGPLLQAQLAELTFKPLTPRTLQP